MWVSGGVLVLRLAHMLQTQVGSCSHGPFIWRPFHLKGPGA